jgi:sugar O-acyltransferase (sialic acid O-acetyltransferase NeuD family)
MDKLFIFPFSGNGIEALNCIDNQFEFLGFIDDSLEKQGGNKFGYRVYNRGILNKYPDAKLLAVPGSPTSFKNRTNIISEIITKKSQLTNVIDSKASISSYAKIGNNVLIMSGVVITANSIIGDHVCILPNTVIHHDSNIGDYTLIGSNVTIAGNTSIGKNCYIGSGSSIINGINVGNDSLIGIGSNVIKHVNKNSKVVGNPAKLL